MTRAKQRLRVSSEARADIAAARNWYRDITPRAGMQFISELESVLRKVQDFPNLFPVVCRDIRRAPMDRYPYCIFYIVDSMNISVIACLHDRQRPEIWQQRR